MRFLLLCSLLCILRSGRSDLPADSCSKLPSLLGFDSASYAGTWFEVMRIPSPGSESPKCVSQTIADGLMGKMSISIKQRNKVGTLIRNGTLMAYDSPSRMLLLFPNDTIKQEYNVISTDYDSYAIVYSCRKWEVNPTESGLVLTRDVPASVKVIGQVKKELSRMAIDAKKFAPTDQKNC